MGNLGRMLGLRKLGAAALLAVLALAGCSSTEGADVEPTQALPDKPVKIDSLKELSGATKYATNGVSLQIPDQMEICSETPLVAYLDRKSTRLNSSHVAISYAVFCLNKKI